MSYANVQARPINRLGVPLPWALLGCIGITVAYVLGNIWLFDSIVRLINSSSNPRFAIFILLVTVAGQALAIFQAVRLAGESRLIERLRQAMADKRGAPLDIQRSALGQVLNREGARGDVAELFDALRADPDGRSVEGDAAAITSRLHRYELATARRLVLPGHVANTLIGLGLFGTFLGLIVTLKDVASLIGIIASTGDADSAATMSRFFTQMSGPLAGMGEAFVASLLGLGGSMVNGLQMLALRRLQAGTAAQAASTYRVVAHSVTGGLQAAGAVPGFDDRLARLQIEAIGGLRQDLSKQTEAILLAASKMRLAGEAMQAMSALAEKRLGSDETRAQVEKIAAGMAQRLETMARKFDDLQVAQHMLAAAAQTSAGMLADINLHAKFIADHNSQVVRELAGLRGTVVDASAQARDHVTQMHAELRNGLQRDLASVVVAMGESTRELRDQTALVSQLGGHAMETNLTLQTLDVGLRDMADRIQPQVVELIARLDAGSQGESLSAKYELAQLNRKLDELGDDLSRQAQQIRDR